MKSYLLLVKRGTWTEFDCSFVSMRILHTKVPASILSPLVESVVVMLDTIYSDHGRENMVFCGGDNDYQRTTKTTLHEGTGSRMSGFG